MRATELAETALSMKNVSSEAEDTWTTFEVIENGELGEQQASRPSSAFSCIEKQKYFLHPEGNYSPFFLHAFVKSLLKEPAACVANNIATENSFLCETLARKAGFILSF